jgi:hypothetical protein
LRPSGRLPTPGPGELVQRLHHPRDGSFLHRRCERELDQREAQWPETVEKHCAPIAGMQVSEINRAAVLRIPHPMWTVKPETARRVRNRIETVLDHAYAWLDIDDRPNPARWEKNLKKALVGDKPVPKHFAALGYDDMAHARHRPRSYASSERRTVFDFALRAFRNERRHRDLRSRRRSG